MTDMVQQSEERTNFFLWSCASEELIQYHLAESSSMAQWNMQWLDVHTLLPPAGLNHAQWFNATLQWAAYKRSNI